MKNTLKILNYLYEKYKELTEGGFHNSLWQLLVNGEENGYVRGNHAFTFIHVPRKGTTNVGIAHRGKSGYTPATFSIKRGTSEKLIEAFLDELNNEIFGINPDLAFEIVAQSMTKASTSEQEEEIS